MSAEKVANLTGEILKGLLPDAIMKRGMCANFNDPSLCGVYLVIPGQTANFPSKEHEYGTLIAFKGYYIVQVYIPNGAGKIYIRTYSSDGSTAWRPWRVITSATLT